MLHRKEEFFVDTFLHWQEERLLSSAASIEEWEGDLLGRGCLFRWVVSRPTASLTPFLLTQQFTSLGTVMQPFELEPKSWGIWLLKVNSLKLFYFSNSITRNETLNQWGTDGIQDLGKPAIERTVNRLIQPTINTARTKKVYDLAASVNPLITEKWRTLLELFSSTKMNKAEHSGT